MKPIFKFGSKSKKVLSLTLVFVMLMSFVPDRKRVIGGETPHTIEFWNGTDSKIDNNVKKTYGDSDFIVTISGAATQLSYSSSNESVAKITGDTSSSSGAIRIIGAGETTISAMAIETDTYASAQAFFTLKVDRKATPQPDSNPSNSGGGGSWNVLDTGSAGGSSGGTTTPSPGQNQMPQIGTQKTLKNIKLPEQLKTRKYINGYKNDDGTFSFKPTEKMTRAEVAQAFYKLLRIDGEKVDNAGLLKFTDVKPDMWYSDAVSYLSNKKIVNGDEGKYNPDQPITRAEVAQILFNIIKSYDTAGKDYKYKYGSVDYKLTDIDGKWYTETIKQLASNGIINGYEDNTFKPNENITRAEFVAMIAKAFGRDIDKATVESKFIDLNPNHWAIKFINDATE